MSGTQPAPRAVADRIHQFIEDERRDAAKYENRSMLDASGAYSLHTLAREIYALGWEEGRGYAAAANRPFSDAT